MAAVVECYYMGGGGDVANRPERRRREKDELESKKSLAPSESWGKAVGGRRLGQPVAARAFGGGNVSSNVERMAPSTSLAWRERLHTVLVYNTVNQPPLSHSTER